MENGKKPEPLSKPEQRQLEQAWRREMGPFFRVVLLILVLLTYCGSMAAIGLHNCGTALRRRWRSRF